jgi:CelD/BcsL family acetyltransferase involved in cellulose biosynthesis
LGDYCYWQFRFKALVLDPSLSQLVRGAVDPHQPLLGAEQDHDQYVIRSFPLEGHLPRTSQAGEFLRYAPAQYDRYFIEFRGTFEEYLSKFSGKTRSTLRRKVRRYGDHSGGLSWRHFRTPAEMAAFYPLAQELSAKTYQERMFQEGFVAHAGSLSHLTSSAERGAVRGYMLFYKGEPAAYVLCSCESETISYDNLGYDPKLRSLSPGDVLLFLIIEQLHAERSFRYLDFGEGESWYKEFYATGSIKCARVYFFRRNLRNRMALATHTAAGAATDSLGTLLSALGVRAVVRRLLRQRATSEEPGATS